MPIPSAGNASQSRRFRSQAKTHPSSNSRGSSEAAHPWRKPDWHRQDLQRQPHDHHAHCRCRMRSNRNRYPLWLCLGAVVWLIILFDNSFRARRQSQLGNSGQRACRTPLLSGMGGRRQRTVSVDRGRCPVGRCPYETEETQPLMPTGFGRRKARRTIDSLKQGAKRANHPGKQQEYNHAHTGSRIQASRMVRD
jgi:hypothetical protein